MPGTTHYIFVLLYYQTQLCIIFHTSGEYVFNGGLRYSHINIVTMTKHFPRSGRYIILMPGIQHITICIVYFKTDIIQIFQLSPDDTIAVIQE